MEYDLKLSKLNESFIRFECERGIAQELSSYFEFYVPGYKFTPAYKNKMWDGKIRLANLKNNTIYYGLIPHIEKFCKERNYKLQIQSELSITEEFSNIEAEEFIEKLKLPIKVRDYQFKSFVNFIRNKRLLLLSPTGSGKSLIIYLIVVYLMAKGLKGLLVVPNISLVSQMKKDFSEYSNDNQTLMNIIHEIHQGKEKDNDKCKLYISTWQSIFTMPEKYFEQFDFIIGDEAHSCKAKSLTTIIGNCVNSKYRLGTTGTLDGTQTHRLVLEGLFGSVFQPTTTSELIEKGQLSEFVIKCLILKHSIEDSLKAKGWDYKEEIDFLVSNEKRNNFIRNLVLSLNGNSLVLFQFVEKHGKILFDMISEKAKNRKVFFVFGGTELETRESIRAITEKESNAIIVASYGVYSTGVNIRNLHNIIFASPTKSRIRNLQSIGRGLRIGENKTKATLYDISDDLRMGKKDNHTLTHFIERVKIYEEQKFKYKFYNIELK